jgi:Arc/MetJ family transcription regulator
MLSNIDINENLIKEAFKYVSVKTKKELVNIALSEFIEIHKKRNLLELKGKVSFVEDYNYKQMRERF